MKEERITKVAFAQSGADFNATCGVAYFKDFPKRSKAKMRSSDYWVGTLPTIYVGLNTPAERYLGWCDRTVKSWKYFRTLRGWYI